METHPLAPGTGSKPGVMSVSSNEGLLGGLGGLSIRAGGTNKVLSTWQASLITSHCPNTNRWWNVKFLCYNEITKAQRDVRSRYDVPHFVGIKNKLKLRIVYKSLVRKLT